MRRKRADDVARKRQAQRDDALRFRQGDEVTHAERCIHRMDGDTACSRVYDPGVLDDEAHEAFYEGTGIGALYGLRDSTADMYASLAGWTVRRGGEFE